MAYLVYWAKKIQRAIFVISEAGRFYVEKPDC